MIVGMPGMQDPDFQLSGNGEVRAFHGGRIVFKSMRFGEVAPFWHTALEGTIEVAIDAGAPYYVDVPFDVLIQKGGALELWHDFSSVGWLTA